MRSTPCRNQHRSAATRLKRLHFFRFRGRNTSPGACGPWEGATLPTPHTGVFAVFPQPLVGADESGPPACSPPPPRSANFPAFRLKTDGMFVVCDKTFVAEVPKAFPPLCALWRLDLIDCSRGFLPWGGLMRIVSGWGWVEGSDATLSCDTDTRRSVGLHRRRRGRGSGRFR